MSKGRTNRDRRVPTMMDDSSWFDRASNLISIYKVE